MIGWVLVLHFVWSGTGYSAYVQGHIYPTRTECEAAGDMVKQAAPKKNMGLFGDGVAYLFEFQCYPVPMDGIR